MYCFVDLVGVVVVEGGGGVFLGVVFDYIFVSLLKYIFVFGSK